MSNFFKNAYEMYRDGFRNMTVGKTLWIVIFVKLAIIFLILKIFFFPDKLNEKYSNDSEKSNAVMESLLNK